jgi:cell shape-determining protein MreC
MTLVNYNERADHIDIMAKQGAEIERLKAEIKRLQSENQHVIWLKHRNEALDKDNKRLRFLLNIVRKND